MDPRVFILYVLSSIAGLIIVCGGMYLIYKDKIYLDRETKTPIEVETPLGKFKTAGGFRFGDVAPGAYWLEAYQGTRVLYRAKTQVDRNLRKDLRLRRR